MAQQALGFGTLRLMRHVTLGTGAYGQVCKATLDDLPCAAKLLHPILVDPNNPRNRTRFEQECRFLSEIRHPNIVQYLGVAQDEESGLPVLLMELMDDSLTHFLEQSEKPLAYHLQVNISHDIALAVAFLHLNRIVHRDLSSNNVLVIGAGSRAKVTDFGMSKLTELNPRMTSLTKCPGTAAYMAPEALLDPPVYTEKLDCFQVGVLMIQIITRKFPDPGRAMNRVRDARYPTGWMIAPVPEVQRRQNHLSLIHQSHSMVQVAVDCLKDVDSERPSAQQICRHLSVLKEAHQYGQSLEESEGERVQESEGEKVQEREELIQQLRQENQEKVIEIRERERSIKSLQSQLQLKEGEITNKEEEIERLQCQLRGKGEESITSRSSQEEFEIDFSDLVFGDFLGEGASAGVFRGRWSSRNLDVALKKCNVPPEASDANILSQLGEHPNIVTFYGFSYDYPHTIIVMELAATGSLYDYLHTKNKNPPQEQSIKWAKQIAYGMAYLHRHDIVHRNLKSHNVLLSGDMEPLLCGFGFARTMHKTGSRCASPVGTYEWMAPEVAFGGNVDQTCDVYSFAMTLWELMEHKLPFGDAPNGLVVAVWAKEGQRPPIGDHWPKYLTKLVQDCWALNRYDRPTFEVIIRAINTTSYQGVS